MGGHTILSENTVLVLHWFVTNNISIGFILVDYYEGESIKNQPNLFLGEIDLFFFDVIAL